METIKKVSCIAVAVSALIGNTFAAELEEIIVTAQKRAESLQDVPLSMTAIEGSKIEEANINSFMDLSEYVPNLSITENAVNTIIGMRGVGIGANQSFEQSVGVYEDGIRDRSPSRGLGDVYKRQMSTFIGNTYAAELEEIIVTAQKRAESLQDVPLSMTAIEGSKIEEANINLSLIHI